MSAQDMYNIALALAAILERMGVPYEIGGSLASSFHGMPRSTLDADIVADLPAIRVREFVALLGDQFYADADVIRSAVAAKKSFNLIFLPTMLKVDVFPVKDTAYARLEFSRRVRLPYPDSNGTLVWIASAEDIILQKLMWYENGGRVADRQIQDVIGVLKIANKKLDRAYLEKWSESLGVAALLKQAQKVVETDS